MSKTAASGVAASVPLRSDAAAVTIGKLARAAEVGVETVRYYPRATIDRIRFIKRSQNLGFSLDEIRELMGLEHGGSRSAIRKIAGDRLTNIREKIASLGEMERVLSELLRQCDRTATAAPCPIIEALGSDSSVAQRHGSRELMPTRRRRAAPPG
jgi:DNA-binding transcriptional MerR regulator